MKKVCVIGHFGFGENLLNGQTVKTKILADELVRRYGEGEVVRVDTHGGVKTLLKLPFVVPFALMRCHNIVILPAQNGLRITTPLLSFWNFFFRRSLHYAVIGGWLAPFLSERGMLRRMLMRFSGVYVETNTMKAALGQQGFGNVLVMPNCKRLAVLSEEALSRHEGEPYRLCTFSRVMREKGIGDAVDAVRAVNESLGRTAYTLDIYGQVDAAETAWFDELRQSFPDYIRYGGLIPFEKSVETLRGSYALLFPTRFYTEGIPGTVIDAYAAGVPVISARWESYADLITENVTGIGYTICDTEALTALLTELVDDPARIDAMRQACLLRARDYLPEYALNVLCDRLR